MEAHRERFTTRRWRRGLPWRRRPRHVNAPARMVARSARMADLRLARRRHCTRRRHGAVGAGHGPARAGRRRLVQTWMGTFEGEPYQLTCPDLQAQRHPDRRTIEFRGQETTHLGLRNFDFVQALRGGALEGELDIAARALHADPWITWLSSGEPSNQAVLLPPGSELAVSLASDRLLWGALECTDVRTQARVQHDRCKLLSVGLRGLEGEAQVEGALKPGRAGWALTLRGAAEDVSLPLVV